MNYDDVLIHLGKFGSYQKRNYVLLCLPIILCAFHKLAGVFLFGIPDHRCELNLPLCVESVNFNFTTLILSIFILSIFFTIYFFIGKLDNELSNATFYLDEIQLNESYPRTDNGFSKCEYFADGVYKNESVREIRKCKEFIWDTSKYQSSVIRTFTMVCDRSDLKPRADALFMAGVFMGSFLFGHLSDKYGRKIVFVLSLLSQLIFGLLVAFSPEFVTFTIARMVS